MELSRRQLLSSLALAPLLPGPLKGWLKSLEPTTVLVTFKHPPGSGEIAIDLKHDRVVDVRWTMSAPKANWVRTITHHLKPNSEPDAGGWQTWVHVGQEWLVQVRCRALPEADQPTLDIDWLSVMESVGPRVGNYWAHWAGLV